MDFTNGGLGGAFASNLVVGDTNSTTDVFLHDSRTGRTQRLSVTTAGVQANGPSFAGVQPSISLNSRYVAFASMATHLVAGDTNGLEDVFVSGPLHP
jgi:Tol biopolymer transport system component